MSSAEREKPQSWTQALLHKSSSCAGPTHLQLCNPNPCASAGDMSCAPQRCQGFLGLQCLWRQGHLWTLTALPTWCTAGCPAAAGTAHYCLKDNKQALSVSMLKMNLLAILGLVLTLGSCYKFSVNETVNPVASSSSHWLHSHSDIQDPSAEAVLAHLWHMAPNCPCRNTSHTFGDGAKPSQAKLSWLPFAKTARGQP